MRRRFFAAFCLFASLICASSAQANWSYLWSQADSESWNNQIVGPFDEIAVWATNGSGMTFQDPALSGFTVPSGFPVSVWTAYNINANTGGYAFTTTPTKYTEFYTNFATNPGVADFLYMASYQGQVRQRQHMTFDAQAQRWSNPAFTGTDAQWHALGGGDPAPIPEPSTFLLFLASPALLCYNLRR